MADFTGNRDDFKALDSDAVGDGVELAQPYDALLEHGLLRNERVLQQFRGANVSLSFWGLRNVATKASTVFWTCPFLLQPGLDQIRIWLTGEFEGVSSVADIDHDLTLGLLQRGESATTTVTVTPSTHPLRKSVELTLDISDVATEAFDVLYLEYTGQTGLYGGNDLSGVDPTLKSQYVYDNGGSAYSPIDDTSNVGPSDADDGLPQGEVLIETNAFSSGNKDGRFVATNTPATQEDPDTPDSSYLYTGSIGSTFYLKVESLSLETDYADSVPIADSPAPSPISARQPVDSAQSTIQHATATGRAMDRVLPVLIGYEGEDRNDEDDWPTDYPERWAYAYGDTYPDLVERSGFYVYSDAPVLHLRMMVIGVNIQNTFQASEFDTLKAAAKQGTWDLQATVTQLNDGAGWGSAPQIAQETETFTLRHWPTEQTGLSNFLLQQYWLHHGDSGGGEPAALGWVFKEGTLWPSDFGLVQFLTMNVPIESASLDRDVPLRLELTGSYNDDAGISDATDALMVGVGFSAWEVPQ